MMTPLQHCKSPKKFLSISVLIPGFFVLLVLTPWLDIPGDRNQQDSKSDETIIVYLTPTCGCCEVWADYLKEEGFEVEIHQVADTTPVRAKKRVPSSLASCHTAVIGDYVVEGHVPAGDIRKLLDEKPDAVAIAVPGMPIGSPGMEVPGREPESYKVLLFDEHDIVEVFTQY